MLFVDVDLQNERIVEDLITDWATEVVERRQWIAGLVARFVLVMQREESGIGK